ncbi:hypothetical protein [Flavobacterium foetidum]|uniref:hypothetical protein n=1 Tax=Flavobacterium foetidum TaxID=2026681 RepID=UPI0010751C9C|nr:hypothetical protein [Flavobacterium foetidum]KAF2514209.1 hypothetical protein E0W73_12435 [Flavobacterium foetidum]
MKKLDIRVILLQFLGITLLTNGILQLRYFSVAEKFLCAINHFNDQTSECWKNSFPSKEDFFNFFPGIYIWIFIGLVIGIFIVSFLNWKNKLSALNTILVALVMYILLKLKLFRRGIISRPFHPIRALFSDDFGTQCLIEGATFTVLGLLILYFSVNFKNNSIEN